MNTFGLAPLVVALPLAGMLINIALGSRMAEKVIGWVASLATGLAFGVAVLLAYGLRANPMGATIPLREWMTIGALHLRWALRVDTLSVVMMLVVAGVGTIIHVYSIGYMHADVQHKGDPKRFARFFVFMNLFIVMMMILVSADNYLMLFVGWEGVGLCSYLLIGFWYEKGEGGVGNAIAAKKAFIVNRMGDFGFLIAAFLMFGAFGSFTFEEVFAQASHVNQGVLLAITLLMLLGVTGKSAQLPLFVWLPDAMAGPTPVSALIHAATMVTAGVYLVARSAPLYTLVPQAQTVVALVGGVTALFAATIALGQFDIKKVLAYSTISQLGFMVAAVGMGAFAAGMFHLVTHAFFKALLFLSAGSVIQGMERGAHHSHDPLDPQDMRHMGGLARRMKLTFVVYLIGALALAGIAPLAGFWSKDEILGEARHSQPAVFVLLITAAFFTAFYMGRQLWLVFLGSPRSQAADQASESPLVMTAPLAILALLSLLGGAVNLPGSHLLTGWLEHTIEGVQPSVFDLGVAAASTALAVAAITLAGWLYGRQRPQQADDPLRKLPLGLFRVFEQKYKVDEFYDWLIVRRVTTFSTWLDRTFDARLIDGMANGLGNAARRSSALASLLESGYVRTYALAVLAGMAAILGYILLR